MDSVWVPRSLRNQRGCNPPSQRAVGKVRPLGTEDADMETPSGRKRNQTEIRKGNLNGHPNVAPLQKGTYGWFDMQNEGHSKGQKGKHAIESGNVRDTL